jgi:hypothetical protein
MGEVFASPKWKPGNYYTCRGGCRDLVEHDGKTYIMAHFQDFYSGDSFADELAAGKWQQITQEHLNVEAGWSPIDSRFDDSRPFLVTDDPTDPDCAMVVSSLSDLNDFGNPYIALKWQDRVPTHWMPVSVAAKVGG